MVRSMDADVLAALVPDWLTAHPDIAWEFADTTDAFAIDLRPASDPSRCARVVAHDATEIFSYSFAGYYTAEFAYDLDEKKAVLEEKIGEAVAAVRGPTQILLEWAGKEIVRSAIGHDAGGQPPQQFTTSFPLSRLWWRLRGGRFRREVLVFPPIPDSA